MDFFSKISESVKFVSYRLRSNPAICILIRKGILDLNYVGSIHQKIQLQDIPHCDEIPLVSSISLYEVTIEGVSVLLLETPHQEVTNSTSNSLLYPIHILANLGLRCIVSIDELECFQTSSMNSDVFVIEDQINLTGIHPLENIQFTSEYSEKIQDCTISYSKAVREICKQASEVLSIELKEATIIGIPNPKLLSNADSLFYSNFRADCIGNIHVFETIVARFYSMVVLSIVIPKNKNEKNNSTMLNERRQMMNGIMNFILPKIYQYLATNSNEIY
jgi:purine nucleoside phosphorylase